MSNGLGKNLSFLRVSAEDLDHCFPLCQWADLGLKETPTPHPSALAPLTEKNKLAVQNCICLSHRCLQGTAAEAKCVWQQPSCTFFWHEMKSVESV